MKKNHEKKGIIRNHKKKEGIKKLYINFSDFFCKSKFFLCKLSSFP